MANPRESSPLAGFFDRGTLYLAPQFCRDPRKPRYSAGFQTELGANCGSWVKEITENEFNLNIPRYVDTFEPEEEIDVAALQKEINRIEGELAEVRGRMAGYLKELGVHVER